MTKIPMSEFMRNYCKEQHIVFSGFERATILWNSNLVRKDKLTVLRDIAETTSDETLRRQIEERLFYEAEIERRFVENSGGNYIFGVSFDDEDRCNGHFSALESALAYGREHANKTFEVGKFPIADKAPPKARRYFHLNRYCIADRLGVAVRQVRDEQTEFYEDPHQENPVAHCEYSIDGEIIGIWSEEAPYPIEIGDPHRFENKFFAPPNPFDRGDLVRVVGDPELGVVSTSQAEWEEFLEQVECGLYVDSVDTCITVEFLHASGEFFHHHPNPLTLERVTEWHNEQEWALMKCAGELLSGKGELDYFLALYDENKERHSTEKNGG